MYDPAAVGRTLGYNGLIIALVGDGLTPLLMSYASTAADEAHETANFQRIKFGLLAVLLPITIALPVYLYRVTGGRAAAAIAKAV